MTENHEDFFARCGDYWVRADSYGLDQAVSLEALYQHFKARLMAELLADVHGTTNYGVLVDRAAIRESAGKGEK